MMEIERDDTFESGHFLPNVPKGHKCATNHGHTYHITIVLAGEPDERTGWLMDFADIDLEWIRVKHLVDHKHLNSVSRKLRNPTVENMVVWIWGIMKPRLPKLVELRLQEGMRNRVVYRPNRDEGKRDG